MHIKINGRGVLSLDAVIAAPTAAAQIKLMAMSMKSSGYVMPSDYLRQLNNIDLAALCDIADKCTFDDEALFNMVCLAEMLATAEGYPALTDEDASKNVGFTTTLLIAESLKRKGAVDIIYDNISFGESKSNDAIILTKDQ